jgi:exopolysaccharide biosynthesis protein
MNSIVLITILLLILQSTSSLEQPSLKNLRAGITTDYDAVKFDPNSLDFSVHQQHLTGNYVSTGKPYSAFLATFPPYRFSFYPAVADGCKRLVKTSESSSTTYNCEYATNGAFFTWDITTTGSLCIGNLISDGKVWQLPTDGSGTGRANFGITADHQVLTGFIDANVIASHNFTQLITGWGWLVRNGVNNVNLSQDLSFSPTGFTYEKAPRTSVGVFANGTMALLEIDGEEDIFYGPDLFEVAELWLSVGAWSVVNIDGGGSSVSVEEGKIISQPTCNDTPEICERAVANIACVRGK